MLQELEIKDKDSYMMRDIKEGGYIGMHFTTTELDTLDDKLKIAMINTYMGDSIKCSGGGVVGGTLCSDPRSLCMGSRGIPDTRKMRGETRTAEEEEGNIRTMKKRNDKNIPTIPTFKDGFQHLQPVSGQYATEGSIGHRPTNLPTDVAYTASVPVGRPAVPQVLPPTTWGGGPPPPPLNLSTVSPTDPRGRVGIAPPADVISPTGVATKLAFDPSALGNKKDTLYYNLSYYHKMIRIAKDIYELLLYRKSLPADKRPSIIDKTVRQYNPNRDINSQKFDPTDTDFDFIIDSFFYQNTDSSVQQRPSGSKTRFSTLVKDSGKLWFYRNSQLLISNLYLHQRIISTMLKSKNRKIFQLYRNNILANIRYSRSEKYKVILSKETEYYKNDDRNRYCNLLFRILDIPHENNNSDIIHNMDDTVVNNVIYDSVNPNEKQILQRKSHYQKEDEYMSRVLLYNKKYSSELLDLYNIINKTQLETEYGRQSRFFNRNKQDGGVFFNKQTSIQSNKDHSDGVEAKATVADENLNFTFEDDPNISDLLTFNDYGYNIRDMKVQPNEYKTLPHKLLSELNDDLFSKILDNKLEPFSPGIFSQKDTINTKGYTSKRNNDRMVNFNKQIKNYLEKTSKIENTLSSFSIALNDLHYALTSYKYVIPKLVTGKQKSDNGININGYDISDEIAKHPYKNIFKTETNTPVNNEERSKNKTETGAKYSGPDMMNTRLSDSLSSILLGNDSRNVYDPSKRTRIENIFSRSFYHKIVSYYYLQNISQKIKVVSRMNIRDDLLGSPTQYGRSQIQESLDGSLYSLLPYFNGDVPRFIKSSNNKDIKQLSEEGVPLYIYCDRLSRKVEYASGATSQQGERYILNLKDIIWKIGAYTKQLADHRNTDAIFADMKQNDTHQINVDSFDKNYAFLSYESYMSQYFNPFRFTFKTKSSTQKSISDVMSINHLSPNTEPGKPTSPNIKSLLYMVCGLIYIKPKIDEYNDLTNKIKPLHGNGRDPVTREILNPLNRVLKYNVPSYVQKIQIKDLATGEILGDRTRSQLVKQFKTISMALNDFKMKGITDEVDARGTPYTPDLLLKDTIASIETVVDYNKQREEDPEATTVAATGEFQDELAEIPDAIYLRYLSDVCKNMIYLINSKHFAENGIAVPGRQTGTNLAFNSEFVEHCHGPADNFIPILNHYFKDIITYEDIKYIDGYIASIDRMQKSLGLSDGGGITKHHRKKNISKGLDEDYMMYDVNSFKPYPKFDIEVLLNRILGLGTVKEEEELKRLVSYANYKSESGNKLNIMDYTYSNGTEYPDFDSLKNLIDMSLKNYKFHNTNMDFNKLMTFILESTNASEEDTRKAPGILSDINKGGIKFLIDYMDNINKKILNTDVVISYKTESSIYQKSGMLGGGPRPPQDAPLPPAFLEPGMKVEGVKQSIDVLQNISNPYIFLISNYSNVYMFNPRDFTRTVLPEDRKYGNESVARKTAIEKAWGLTDDVSQALNRITDSVNISINTEWNEVSNFFGMITEDRSLGEMVPGMSNTDTSGIFNSIYVASLSGRDISGTPKPPDFRSEESNKDCKHYYCNFDGYHNYKINADLLFSQKYIVNHDLHNNIIGRDSNIKVWPPSQGDPNQRQARINAGISVGQSTIQYHGALPNTGDLSNNYITSYENALLYTYIVDMWNVNSDNNEFLNMFDSYANYNFKQMFGNLEGEFTVHQEELTEGEAESSKSNKRIDSIMSELINGKPLPCGEPSDKDVEKLMHRMEGILCKNRGSQYSSEYLHDSLTIGEWRNIVIELLMRGMSSYMKVGYYSGNAGKPLQHTITKKMKTIRDIIDETLMGGESEDDKQAREAENEEHIRGVMKEAHDAAVAANMTEEQVQAAKRAAADRARQILKEADMATRTPHAQMGINSHRDMDPIAMNSFRNILYHKKISAETLKQLNKKMHDARVLDHYKGSDAAAAGLSEEKLLGKGPYRAFTQIYNLQGDGGDLWKTSPVIRTYERNIVINHAYTKKYPNPITDIVTSILSRGNRPKNNTESLIRKTCQVIKQSIQEYVTETVKDSMMKEQGTFLHNNNTMHGSFNNVLEFECEKKYKNIYKRLKDNAPTANDTSILNIISKKDIEDDVITCMCRDMPTTSNGSRVPQSFILCPLPLIMDAGGSNIKYPDTQFKSYEVWKYIQALEIDNKKLPDLLSEINEGYINAVYSVSELLMPMITYVGSNPDGPKNDRLDGTYPLSSHVFSFCNVDTDEVPDEKVVRQAGVSGESGRVSQSSQFRQMR